MHLLVLCLVEPVRIKLIAHALENAHYVCKTGRKLGQMTQVLERVRSAEILTKLVLSAGKSEDDVIEASSIFELGKVGGTTIARYFPWQVDKT